MPERPASALRHNSPNGRGRPRDPNWDDAILAATIRCLARDGYSRMTVDAVASEAGVTRPTVYRRWPTKADLTTAAISDLVSRDTPISSGDAYRDLLEIMRALYRALIQQGRMALFGSIFAEDHHNPGFVDLFRERVIRPRQRQIQEIVVQGKASGQIKSDIDGGLVADFFIGSFLSRYISGERIPKAFPEKVLRSLWPAITTSNPAHGVSASTPERSE